LKYDDLWYTKNFSYLEMTARDYTMNDIMVMRQDFMSLLQRLREALGIPVYVSHALRSWSEQFYYVCGGDPKKYYESEHQFGNAADIYISFGDVKGMIYLTSLAKMIGFNRIGLYPYSGCKFVHVDMGIPKPSESWIRNKNGVYTYYNTVTEAIKTIEKREDGEYSLEKLEEPKKKSKK
jgi:uncharacterized protein YcbK (DUF882 family)